MQADRRSLAPLDLQKPEFNDQILIRCIHRLLTDHRAQDIFNAYADDFDRQAAQQAQAADGKPKSPTNPVDDSDSAPSMETRCASEEHSPIDSGSPAIETRRISEERSPTEPAHSAPAWSELAQPTSCAPAPGANNSPHSTADSTTQTEAPQRQPPVAPAPTPPNFCALTPQAPSAETQRATCEVTAAPAPSRPPPLSDLSALQCAMITFG